MPKATPGLLFWTVPTILKNKKNVTTGGTTARLFNPPDKSKLGRNKIVLSYICTLTNRFDLNIC